MSDLRRWTPPVDAGPFRFGKRGAPVVTTVVRRVVKPGPSGPIEIGRIVSRYVGGRLVERVSFE